MPTSLASIPSNKSPEVSQVHSARVRPKLKLQPLVRDIGLTIATELFVLVSILLVTSLMGRLLGASPLGEYLLVRRVVAWLYSGAQLGLGVALPRYVAYAVNSSDGKRESYFIAAFSLLLGTALCLGVVLFIGRPHVSQWLFGSAQLTRLMLPLWFLILGLLTHAAVYGYYRGCLLIARANAMQLSNSLLALITVLVLYRLHSLPLIVTTMGCCTVVNAGVFAVPIFSTIKAHTWPAGFINHAFELLRYGIGRVPGDFGSSALFALGPMVAAHYMPMARVSYLLLGLNILMAVGYSAAPLGIVLLSKLSIMLSQNRRTDVQARLEQLLTAVVDISAFTCCQLLVFADIVIRAWVGPGFLGATLVVRLLVLAIPPYLLYAALRSSIDAASVKPRNAANIGVALIAYLICIGLTTKLASLPYLLDGLAASLLAALVVLGFLSANTVRRLYDCRMPWSRVGRSVAISIFLGIVSVGFRAIYSSQGSIVGVVAFECAISIVFVAFLMRQRSSWVQYLVSRCA